MEKTTEQPRPVTAAELDKVAGGSLFNGRRPPGVPPPGWPFLPKPPRFPRWPIIIFK